MTDSHWFLTPALSVLFCFLLGACSNLPAFGPSRQDIFESVGQREQAPEKQDLLGFQIVEINRNVITATAASLSLDDDPFRRLAGGRAVDAIVPGDVLSVSIFEAGPGLFTASTGVQSGAEDALVTAAGSGQMTIPRLTVARDGTIFIPYAGRLKVSGKTTVEASAEILKRLKGKATDPQILVERIENVGNKAVVLGDIRSPGRYPLTLAHEHLLDVVAEAGGPTHSDRETLVTLSRQGRGAMAQLSKIARNADYDVSIEPGDRIELRYNPKTYMIFGASGRVSEIPFEADTVTLAQGIARGGGLQDFQADPEGVFVFRKEDAASSKNLGLRTAGDTSLIIYHVNLAFPGSYFSIRDFQLKDKDIVYISDAPSVKIQKLLGILNGVFAPVATSRTVAQ